MTKSSPTSESGISIGFVISEEVLRTGFKRIFGLTSPPSSSSVVIKETGSVITEGVFLPLIRGGFLSSSEALSVDVPLSISFDFSNFCDFFVRFRDGRTSSSSSLV